MRGAVRRLLHPAHYLRGRLQIWARRRQGADSDPVRIHRRRTYILPTWLGVGFGMLIFAMLLAAMNYNNSMGFALTFLLAALGLVTMHWCHQNMTGLIVRGIRLEPVFAGNPPVLELALENPSASHRYELVVACQAREATPVDLPPGATVPVKLKLPPTGRGRLEIKCVGITTRFPFGLFRCWIWLYPDVSGIVYPRVAHRGVVPPPDLAEGGGASNERLGEEDFAGLRNFRPGDSPRRVAWKAMARGGDLLVKQFAGAEVTTRWLAWADTPERDPEERLSRLCRWVVDAHAHGQAYGLRLPGLEHTPAVGRRHRHRCLSALATYPGLVGRAPGDRP
jgi:uncharacterized protein (DUF58 family)